MYVGNWGIYIDLPSENIIASDIETGLFVIKLGGLSIQHQSIPDVNIQESPYVGFSAEVSSFNSQIEDVYLHYSLDGMNWSQTSMYNSGFESIYNATMTFDEENVLVR